MSCWDLVRVRARVQGEEQRVGIARAAMNGERKLPLTQQHLQMHTTHTSTHTHTHTNAGTHACLSAACPRFCAWHIIFMSPVAVCVGVCVELHPCASCANGKSFARTQHLLNFWWLRCEIYELRFVSPNRHIIITHTHIDTHNSSQGMPLN